MSAPPFANTIETVLHRLHEAIRTASFDELSPISANLETVLQDVSQLNEASLRRINRLADRNAACLMAAEQGLRAGRRRVAEIAAAGRADVYDSAGDRRSLPMDGLGRRL